MDSTTARHWRTTAFYPLYALLLLLVFCLPLRSHADASQHVVIITSSDSSYQHQTAVMIHENLDAAGIRTMTISANDIATTTRNGRTLYVTIGDRAAKRLDEFDSNAMTLRLSGKKTADRKYNSTKSDLITGQPACRHVQLVKSLNPNWQTIGVLSSIDSLDTAAALTKCAIRFDLNLQVYAIVDTRDLLRTLETAVETNKVLLAINDPIVYNRDTLKNILLTAYRHRTPVIGYSDSFVQAGAIAAIYSSPASTGEKAAQIITAFFSNNWQFSKDIYYTDDFSISINTQVARSLDLDLPTEESIRSNIIRMETKP